VTCAAPRWRHRHAARAEDCGAAARWRDAARGRMTLADNSYQPTSLSGGHHHEAGNGMGHPEIDRTRLRSICVAGRSGAAEGRGEDQL
jgi:hypothetical protein